MPVKDLDVGIIGFLVFVGVTDSDVDTSVCKNWEQDRDLGCRIPCRAVCVFPGYFGLHERSV